MKFCPHCSKEFTLEKSHCSECGRPLILLPQKEEDSMSFFDTDYDYSNYSDSLFSKSVQKDNDDTNFSHPESLFDLDETETASLSETTQVVTEPNKQNFLANFSPSDTIASLHSLHENVTGEVVKVGENNKIEVGAKTPTQDDELEKSLFDITAFDLEKGTNNTIIEVTQNSDEALIEDDVFSITTDTSVDEVGIITEQAKIVLDKDSTLEVEVIKDEDFDLSSAESENGTEFEPTNGNTKLSIEEELTKTLIEADELIEANIKTTSMRFDDFEITHYEIEDVPTGRATEESEKQSDMLEEITQIEPVEELFEATHSEITDDLTAIADAIENEKTSVEDELTNILIEADELIEANYRTTAKRLDDFEKTRYEHEEKQAGSTIEDSEPTLVEDDEQLVDMTEEVSQVELDDELSEDATTETADDLSEIVDVIENEEVLAEEELTDSTIEDSEPTLVEDDEQLVDMTEEVSQVELDDELSEDATTETADDLSEIVDAIENEEVLAEEELTDSTIEDSEPTLVEDDEQLVDMTEEVSQVELDDELSEDATTETADDLSEIVDAIENEEVLAEEELTDSTIEDSEPTLVEDDEQLVDMTEEVSQAELDDELSEDATTETTDDLSEIVDVIENEEVLAEEELTDSTIEDAEPTLVVDDEQLVDMTEVVSQAELDDELSEDATTETTDDLSEIVDVIENEEVLAEEELTDSTIEDSEPTLVEDDEQLVDMTEAVSQVELKEELETPEDEPSTLDNLDWRSEKYDPRNSPIDPERIRQNELALQQTLEDITDETILPISEENEELPETNEDEQHEEMAEEETSVNDTDELSTESIDTFGIESLPFYRVLAIIFAVFIFVLLGLLCLLVLNGSVAIKLGGLLVASAISLIFYYTLKLALKHFENSARTAQELTTLRQMLEKDKTANLKGGFPKK